MTVNVFTNAIPKAMVVDVEVGFNSVLLVHNAPEDLDLSGVVTWVKLTEGLAEDAVKTLNPYTGLNHTTVVDLLVGTEYDISSAFVDTFVSSNELLLNAQYQGVNSLLNISNLPTVTTASPMVIESIVRTSSVTSPGSVVGVDITFTKEEPNVSSILLEVQDAELEDGPWTTLFTGATGKVLSMPIKTGIYNFRLFSFKTFSTGVVEAQEPTFLTNYEILEYVIDINVDFTDITRTQATLLNTTDEILEDLISLNTRSQNFITKDVQNFADIRITQETLLTETQARAIETIEVGARIGDSEANIINVRDALATETLARSTQVEQINARLTENESDIAVSEADIILVNEAVVTESTARATQAGLLSTRVGDTESSISRIDTALSTETEARANLATALNTRIDTAEGSIDTLSSTVSTNASASAATQVAVQSQFEDVNALVVALDSTLATETLARATSDITLTAAVSGLETNKATVTALNEAVSDLEADITTASTTLQAEITGESTDAIGSSLTLWAARNGVNAENGARQEAITDLRAEITGDAGWDAASSLTLTAVEDAVGDLEAQFYLVADVNGRIAGVKGSSDGTLSTLDFIGDKIRFVRPGDFSVAFEYSTETEDFVFGGALSAESGTIGGWSIGETLLKSADTGARIELNSTKNRISVFDTNVEKVVMGYLHNLPKNSGVADEVWGPGDYGFWAKNGDKLVIDGDVEYENGDWLIQNDASYLVQTADGDDIIRLGTSGTSKGLFMYNSNNVVVTSLTQGAVRLGAAGAAQYMEYTSAGLVVKGDITGSSGTFSDTVSAATITGSNITGGTIQTSASTEVPRVVLNGAAALPFWFGTGAVSTTNGKFYGNNAGNIFAKGLTIDGTSSFSGTLSGANITGTTGTFSSRVAVSSTNGYLFDMRTTSYRGFSLWYGLAADSADRTVATTLFGVDHGGTVYAKNMEISGDSTFGGSITSGSTITGANITGGIIQTAGSNLIPRVVLNGVATIPFWFGTGAVETDNAKFYGNSEGSLFAKGLTIDGNSSFTGTVTAASGTIGGWKLDATLLKSADTGARVELNSTKNRISIFDTNVEKVVMGYLQGLPKNPKDDEEPADVQNWTAGDYGFWAAAGDKLVIDGDVEYENGDWLIQNDASYLVQTAAGQDIIRMGTSSGTKGLFMYNSDSVETARMTGSTLKIGTGDTYMEYTSTGLVVKGDITGSSGTFSDNVSGATITGGTITGGTITGGIVQTSASTEIPRVVLNGTAALPFWFGTGNVNTTNGKFYGNNAGNIFAKGLTIDGDSSFSGTLSGANISGTTGTFSSRVAVNSTNGYLIDIRPDSYMGFSLWYGLATHSASQRSVANTLFGVTNAGTVYAKNIQISGTSTFSGALSGATGSFSGTLSASTITGSNITGGIIQTAGSTQIPRVVLNGTAALPFWFGTGNVSTTNGRFYGNSAGNIFAKGLTIDGTSSFSGTLSGADITGTTGTFSSRVAVSSTNSYLFDIRTTSYRGFNLWYGLAADSAQRTIATTLFGVNNAGTVYAKNIQISGTSTFSGALSGASGSFSGTLSGADITGASGAFSGTLSIGNRYNVNTNGDTTYYLGSSAVGASGRLTIGETGFDFRDGTGVSRLNILPTSGRLAIVPINGLPQAISIGGGGGNGAGQGVSAYGTTNAFYSRGGGYGPFTGTHDALILNDTTIEPGDIVFDSSFIASSSVSDTITEIAPTITANTKSVVGIFVSASNTDVGDLPAAMTESLGYEDTHQRAVINSVGEGMLNVCGQGGNIEAGDLITSSNLQGKGMKQADNLVRNYTVAKARQDVTFDSPSEIKQIAVIYMCG